MEVKGLRWDMILAPRPGSGSVGMPYCCWLKAGRHWRWGRHRNGTLTPSNDEKRPSGNSDHRKHDVRRYRTVLQSRAERLLQDLQAD